MKLILYHYESCFYCRMVRDAIDRLGITGIEYRDTRKNPAFRNELIEMNGKSQVPCLVIDGRPMLESEDIIRFLETNFAKP